MGTIDETVTANHPFAVVFKKAGDKTYVAHNYGASEITVTFSDGFSMPVPAKTLKTSKGLAVTATVTASATEVVTNGSVDLTTNVNGSGITKVEFYDGTVLLGTSTTAPYTFTAANLSARVHGFYAKVYVGTALALSNVASVVVGAQLPYQGNIVSIPAQPIEPGNYDYYEGGTGQQISYFDITSTNDASNAFRTNEYVDAVSIPGEGNIISHIADGEWVEYTVNIEQTGTYDLSFRYVSGNTAGGGPFHIEVDGNTVSNNITMAFTGNNWNVWATKTVAGIILPQGQHIIRLVFDKAGFNIGRLNFSYKGAATPFLTVSSADIAIEPYANSKKEINLSANVNWTAASNQPWLTVAPSGGFGDSKITFTAQENPDASTRVATVTFSGNNVDSKVVTITQDGGGVPYVVVTPPTMQFAYNTNTPQTINITSNTAWTASSNQPWLTLNNANGTGIAAITATASVNNGTAGRSATITISADGIPDKTVTVNQSGTPISITLPIDFELDGTYVFSDFNGGIGTVVANPFKGAGNASNKTGMIIRNGGESWAGSFLTLNQTLNFTSLTTISMKVFSTKAGVPILLKLEGSGDPSQIQSLTTVANNWETINWNFAGKPSNVYNKLVFMFDFGAVGDGSANSTFHFDDIQQIMAPVTNSWTGTVSNAWENAANWSRNAVPTAASIVTIPAGRPRYPVVNANTSVRSITCAQGTSVSVAPGVVLTILE